VHTPSLLALDVPDLTDHREQKRRREPEQQRAVESLKCTHELPVLLQEQVGVAIACQCAQRIYE